MARRRPKNDPPLEACPPNGLACAECGEPQRTTPGGPSCTNGHGGAEGVPIVVDTAALGTSFFHGGPTDGSESVTPVKVSDPTRLVTIESTDEIWKQDDDLTRSFPNVRGAIVRVRPPADIDDASLAGLVTLLEARGAAHVFTLPRPRSGVIPEQAQEANTAKAYGAREAVATLVAESNSSDREALEKLTEKIMAEAGL